jgi:hypothetical protein
MTTTPRSTAVSRAAAAQARKDVLARCVAIMGLPEAKSKHLLANSLAADTEMTVEEARAFLIQSDPDPVPNESMHGRLAQAMSRRYPQVRGQQ